MNLISLIIILLLPLIPTAIIYRYIKDRRTRAGAKGSLFGIGFETKGAVASYVIFCLLAFFAYRLIQGEVVAAVRFRLYPVSDSDAGLIEFLQHHAQSVEVTLEREGSEPVQITGFSVISNDGVLISNDQNIPLSYLGKKFKVFIQPSRLFTSVEPQSLVLGRQNNLQVVLSTHQERQDWVADLDVKSVLFSDHGTKVRLREFFVLRNPGPQALESAIFNGYVMDGDIITMEVSSRKIPETELANFTQRWARSALQGFGAEEILKLVDQAWAEIPQKGQEIGFRRLINRDFEDLVTLERVERGNLRVDGTSPVVGPIGGGIATNNGMIVTVEINSRYRSAPLRLGEEDHLGSLFERNCERVFLITRTDGSLAIDSSRIRLEFKEKAGQLVSSLGNPVLRTSDTTAIVDLANVGAADVARMYWVWKPLVLPTVNTK